MSSIKLTFTKYALATLLAMSAVGAQAGGSLSVMYGNKSMDKNDWEPLDSQTEIGFGVAYQQADWPLAMVVSYTSSEDSFTDDMSFTVPVKFKAETTEVDFGVRKNVTEDKAKVFIEGGLGLISAKITASDSVTSESESDSAMGFWFGAGLDVTVADAVSVGALVRISNASVTLFDFDAEAGGTHFNVFAAYHF